MPCQHSRCQRWKIKRLRGDSPANLYIQEHVMAGRGPQSFKKRQKEQLRKEKQQEKNAKRAERRTLGGVSPLEEEIPLLDGPVIFEVDEADLPWDGTPRVSERETNYPPYGI